MDFTRTYMAKRLKDLHRRICTLDNIEIADENAKQYLDAIKQNRSLSIHIRRGDYVTLGWAVETEQYKKMTEIFRKDVPGDWQLFVFSDDIEWCKTHESELGFRQFEKIIYVEGNTNGKN